MIAIKLGQQVRHRRSRAALDDSRRHRVPAPYRGDGIDVDPDLGFVHGDRQISAVVRAARSARPWRRPAVVRHIPEVAFRPFVPCVRHRDGQQHPGPAGRVHPARAASTNSTASTCPTHAERQEIFGIHLKLRKREPEQFDLDALARKTEGYTGADVKEVVQLGLKLAFHAEAQLANDHLLAAIPEIRPLSKTDPESVTEVTKWLDSHTKPADNGHSTSPPVNGNPRKRRVTV